MKIKIRTLCSTFHTTHMPKEEETKPRGNLFSKTRIPPLVFSK